MRSCVLFFESCLCWRATGLPAVLLSLCCSLTKTVEHPFSLGVDSGGGILISLAVSSFSLQMVFGQVGVPLAYLLDRSAVAACY